MKRPARRRQVDVPVAPVFYTSPDWRPENAIPDFPEYANDYDILSEEAQLALARRRSGYPPLVKAGKMAKEDAASDLAAWRLIVQEWTWIATGEGEPPPPETLEERKAALRDAIGRIEAAIERGQQGAAIWRQLACTEAMLWHLGRIKFGAPTVHFCADLTRKIRADIAAKRAAGSSSKTEGTTNV